MAQAAASPGGFDRDQAADLPALIAAHHATVFRYARRLAGCPVEAEDLTQQTFLIAQQKLGQVRDQARAGGWLLAIARNCFLKSRRRQRPATAEAIGLTIDDVPNPTPSGESIDQEALHKALAELADEFRIVLLMFYFEELSYQEIAAQLELPVGTVMSRLSRAKGHLRARLAPPAEEPIRSVVRRSLNGNAPMSIPVNVAR
jgi:RNA polymerase sigma-70 factor, ECF subfamily